MPLILNGDGLISGATSFTSAATFTQGVSLPNGTTLNGVSLNNSKVLQVSQINATPVTVSSGGTSTFATLSITPSSTSNKILVMCNAYARASSTSGNKFARIIINRGATTVSDGYVIGSFNGSTDIRGMAAIAKLDSPSTISQVSYVASLYSLATTCQIDDVYGPSTFTLMEIAA